MSRDDDLDFEQHDKLVRKSIQIASSPEGLPCEYAILGGWRSRNNQPPVLVDKYKLCGFPSVKWAAFFGRFEADYIKPVCWRHSTNPHFVGKAMKWIEDQALLKRIKFNT